MADRAPLLELLDAAATRGGLQTDDVLTIVRPLFAQVAALQAAGLVASLDGERSLALDESANLKLLRPEGEAPRSNSAAI